MAFWIPGPDDLDMDEGLKLGYARLERSARPCRPVVVLHAMKTVNNRQTRRHHEDDSAGRNSSVRPEAASRSVQDEGPRPQGRFRPAGNGLPGRAPGRVYQFPGGESPSGTHQPDALNDA